MFSIIISVCKVCILFLTRSLYSSTISGLPNFISQVFLLSFAFDVLVESLSFNLDVTKTWSELLLSPRILLTPISPGKWHSINTWSIWFCFTPSLDTHHILLMFFLWNWVLLTDMLITIANSANLMPFDTPWKLSFPTTRLSCLLFLNERWDLLLWFLSRSWALLDNIVLIASRIHPIFNVCFIRWSSAFEYCPCLSVWSLGWLGCLLYTDPIEQSLL